ncbi:MAG: NAD(P)-dependent oxidoreductase [Deltaproteobacteria bacterium]|nr:NAD(P)-dependent oxidoreductase [Deltaproteobacteria bacterium]MBN2673795.1 NAD(P)-dependent oxidoreductase [Deltaproteobacteria bacterium]
MNIFITGGTGFIGSWVVKELLQFHPDADLVLLARNPNKIPEFQTHSRIQIVHAELSDFSRIKEAMSGCDTCIHIALGWGETPLTMLENDTRCTVHLLECAANLKMKRFIYTSSTAAGGHDRSYIAETSDPLPADLYGATKLASEAYVRGVSSQLGLPAHIIRPGYTFGNPSFPGATPQVDQRFHNIVRAALKNDPIQLTKEDGTQFISAAALAKLYTGCMNLNDSCQTFYGLGTRFVTWEKIAEMAVYKTGSSSRIVLDDKGWAKGTANFDVKKINRYFGISTDPLDEIDTHLDWLIETLRQDL